MADQHSEEGVSTSNVSEESSDSTVELNIKTLDSQIHSFHVNKNIPVPIFKETIASEIGVPVAQQRLIFRGKVLKDDHLLSDYHVENGHTLHLVARQPSQPQSSSGTSSGETTADNNSTGQDASAAGSRPRVGQVAHRVLLGTFGVGDQSEGGVPDINQVIGAVLNSFGIGGQTVLGGAGGPQPNMQFNIPVHAPQGNETEASPVNGSNQGQARNQSHPRQAFPGQSMPQVMQIPLGAAMAVPSLTTPIPDSLNALSEFMNRMELALSETGGDHPNGSQNNAESLPAVELPSNAHGLRTPAALAVVLRHAQRLFSGPAIASLSHTAGRLEEEEGSTDLTVRSQIQTESMQAGLAMQHLGALLLELGRTMLTLRIGQSPAESSVNAGPAVYISPSGPNPIMVQPFPLQTSSLFGGHAAPPLNPGAFGPVGIGAVPRHVNIHIHAGVGPRATNGEANQGERAHGTGDSDQTRARNATGTAIPSRPTAVSASSEVQPSAPIPQPSPETASLSSIIGAVDSQIRNIADDTRSENLASTGQRDGSSGHDQSIGNATSTSGSAESGSSESSESAAAVPLGLGMGGLQPKRQRSRQLRSLESLPSIDQNRTRPYGQEVLRSLASMRSTSTLSRGQQSSAAAAVAAMGGQHPGVQHDPASIMSQVIASPALDGLLTGVSQQTGIGSPDVLRNMLGQLMQNPAMMSTVNQLAQQIDRHDLGSMFSGMGGGQGSSGMDLSRMMQQMMPLVSQALGGGSNVNQQVPSVDRELQPQYTVRRPGSDEKPSGQLSQIDLQRVAQKIEQQDPPEEVLSSVVESAVCLYGNDSNAVNLADELCSEEGLADEFMEMLRRDVCRRLRDES